MNQDKAKKALSKMLDSYTPGSVLHLMGDIFRDAAEEARRADDDILFQRCRNLEAALFVMGCGIDAAYPQ